MTTFDKCQEEYDNRTPDDEEGCEHSWRHLGLDFYVCRKCGLQSEI